MAESLSADAGTGVKALWIRCTLKRSLAVSQHRGPNDRVLDLLGEHGVETEILRPVDYDDQVRRRSDEGNRDRSPGSWRRSRGPTSADRDVYLVGVRSSVCQMVVERLDGTYNKRNDVGQYPLYNKVAGSSSPATRTAPTPAPRPPLST